MLLLVVLLRAGEPALVLREVVAARLSVPVTDVEVGGLGVEGLEADLDWRVDLPALGPWWGSVPVVLRSADGTRRYAIRPEITVWQELPVAARSTRAGDPVEPASARVSRASLRGETPVDPGARWEARVDLAAGQPLTTSRVRPLPDAQAGSLVEIVAGSPGLRVMANGRLGADAFVGQPVTVSNLDTHALLVGVFMSDGSVWVGGAR